MPLLGRSQHPRIVNMASGLGSLALNSDPDYEFAKVKLSAYNTSKAGVTMLTIVYASRLRGHSGYRTAEQGAAIAIKLATLDDAGPSGGFFNEAGPVPW